MEKTMEQIKARIEALDKKQEYALSNAWESVQYLVHEYNDVPVSKKDTFKEWYDEQKQSWLKGSGAVTDIDFWVGDVEELGNTDISEDDFTLFDIYFNSLLDNLK